MPKQQQPSEVQIILDDALTDLEALVDHYLPATSKDGGGFAGRIMAALEQVGASATKSIGGDMAAPESGGSGDRADRNQPARARSNTNTSRSQYSESSVEISYDERTYDSEYDTNDTRSYYSSANTSAAELKPVAAVVVRGKDKSKASGANLKKSQDELMNQTIDTAVNTTVDALDTSYLTLEDDEEEEPAAISTAAPPASNKVETDDLDMGETAAIDKPLPESESPRRKAEREADEAAERLAHRSYFSKKSSFDQLLEETSSNKGETKTEKALPSTDPPRNDPTNGKNSVEKAHNLIQKYRQEKKQQMAEGTAPDDEFATDAVAERRREDRRAVERRWRAAVTEHRRRLAHNIVQKRQGGGAVAAAVEKAEMALLDNIVRQAKNGGAVAVASEKAEMVQKDMAGTPPPGLNSSDNNSENTTDSLADELQSMVVTDLD